MSVASLMAKLNSTVLFTSPNHPCTDPYMSFHFLKVDTLPSLLLTGSRQTLILKATIPVSPSSYYPLYYYKPFYV